MAVIAGRPGGGSQHDTFVGFMSTVERASAVGLRRAGGEREREAGEAVNLSPLSPPPPSSHLACQDGERESGRPAGQTYTNHTIQNSYPPLFLPA